MPALAPLMILIEVISHLARVLSLTIRLYANMFAGDMVTLVVFSLLPLISQLLSWASYLRFAFANVCSLLPVPRSICRARWPRSAEFIAK